MNKVLIVDDDAALRDALTMTLGRLGFDTLSATNGSDALMQVKRNSVGLVLSDVQMPGMDGSELLTNLRQLAPKLPVVLMTAYGNVEQAVSAIQLGANDYLLKPFDTETLVNKVKTLLQMTALTTQAPIAQSLVMQKTLRLAQRVANTDTTVLLCGPSGAGKEVIARYIHAHSPHAKGPYVAMNCAAIPENMLEAMLFGYEKGAFTGAHKSMPGKFELANGGTLLLDEISEMAMELQAKLLRVLQEREVERLGSRHTVQLNCRILATTNRNLREEVAAQRFREDLLYRLNVFPIQLPPLSARIEDIEPLAIQLLAHHHGNVDAALLSTEALAKLAAHDWPGNVRELDNVLQRALILKEAKQIRACDIQFETSFAAGVSSPVNGGELARDLQGREQQVIIEALEASGGSRKQAAERLGISSRTLRHKLARLRDLGVAIPNAGSGTQAG